MKRFMRVGVPLLLLLIVLAFGPFGWRSFRERGAMQVSQGGPQGRAGERGAVDASAPQQERSDHASPTRRAVKAAPASAAADTTQMDWVRIPGTPVGLWPKP